MGSIDHDPSSVRDADDLPALNALKIDDLAMPVAAAAVPRVKAMGCAPLLGVVGRNAASKMVNEVSIEVGLFGLPPLTLW
jgi:hypothetical protein